MATLSRFRQLQLGQQLVPAGVQTLSHSGHGRNHQHPIRLIGTHAGRRTFICFALSSGIPPQGVMKWTGHSDYQAMKPYIEIAEKTKADAMALFESEMSK